MRLTTPEAVLEAAFGTRIITMLVFNDLPSLNGALRGQSPEKVPQTVLCWL